jgi:hypothetical protein
VAVFAVECMMNLPDGGGVKLIQFGGVKLIHPFVQ